MITARSGAIEVSFMNLATETLTYKWTFGDLDADRLKDKLNDSQSLHLVKGKIS